MNTHQQQNRKISMNINLLKQLFFLCVLFFNLNGLNAQNYDLLDIPFIVEGEQVLNPFVGGFEAPQITTPDLNRDGIKDILAFDRKGQQVMTFINDGLGNGSESFKYNPKFQKNIPVFQNWVEVVDYNNDGIEDLFCAPLDFVQGIGVYTGYEEGGELKFERYIFDAFANGDYALNIAVHLFGGIYSNIYCSNVDRPSIVDIDHDGDLDILSFGQGTTIWYFKNLAIENGLGLDKLEFAYESNCFGQFYESGLSEEIILSDDPTLCAAGFSPGGNQSGDRHSGSTILSLDNDQDGDYDIILGDFTSNRLVLLENGGDEIDAWITDTDIRFPSYDVPVEMDLFLGTFYEDVDQDGIKDLLIAPNQFNSSENINNLHFYKNQGANDAPDFNFVQKDFLNEAMLDFGSFCQPTFADINQDGLIDIVMGGEGGYDPLDPEVISFVYFENTGTAAAPKYELKDDDYLGFNEFRQSISRPTPTFGDLDGDGDLDLLIGALEGFLVYYENMAGPGMPAEYPNYSWEYMGIDIGKHAKPFIIDLDEDGLMDIVVGNESKIEWTFSDTIVGDLVFYKNVGQVGNPMFNADHKELPNISGLGTVNVIDAGYLKNYSSPFVLKVENDFKLFVGNEAGNIDVFSSIKDNLDGMFELDEKALGNLKTGSNAVISFADIDDDGYLELIQGNSRGGFGIFNTLVRNDGVITETEEITTLDHRSFDVYPNPTNETLSLLLDDFESAQLIDVNGRIIMKSSERTLDVSHLNSGIYYVKAFKDGKIELSSFVKY